MHLKMGWLVMLCSLRLEGPDPLLGLALLMGLLLLRGKGMIPRGEVHDGPSAHEAAIRERLNLRQDAGLQGIVEPARVGDPGRLFQGDVGIRDPGHPTRLGHGDGTD